MNQKTDEARHRTAFRRSLLGWYRQSARDLPWRRTDIPYRIWLSEMMLQQTQVETVIPYYRNFLKAFPSVRALASASLDRVLKQWEGLGYYTRARNLHRAAQAIVADHRGRFPRTAKQLQTLPGIGRYSAGAIASIAFGESVSVLDGNVKRVLARLYNISDSIDDSATVRRLWELAERLVPQKEPGDFNQAMMELGARICTPRTPGCSDCPVRTRCAAKTAGTVMRLPVRRAKKPVPHQTIVVALIEKNGRYLIGQRPPKGLLGGLWEFPGGKVEPGETHQQALVREVDEECRLAIQVGSKVATVKHAYSHFRITLHAYACKPISGRVRARFHDRLQWVVPSRFDRYAFPAANHKFLHRVGPHRSAAKG